MNNIIICYISLRSIFLDVENPRSKLICYICWITESLVQCRFIFLKHCYGYNFNISHNWSNGSVDAVRGMLELFVSGVQQGNAGSGWFGGILSKFSRKSKNEIKLPDDKDPTVSRDRVQKLSAQPINVTIHHFLLAVHFLYQDMFHHNALWYTVPGNLLRSLD